MEFWEGAVLTAAGVWLVVHMAGRSRQGTANVIHQSTLGLAGTSNESNLTNITNMAGSTTIAGESLVAPAPVVSAPIVAPVKPVTLQRPIATPYIQGPYAGIAAVKSSPVRIMTL